MLTTNQIRKWVSPHHFYTRAESEFFIVLGTVDTSGRHLYLWKCKDLKTGKLFNEYQMEILTKSIEVKNDKND